MAVLQNCRLYILRNPNTVQVVIWPEHWEAPLEQCYLALLGLNHWSRLISSGFLCLSFWRCISTHLTCWFHTLFFSIVWPFCLSKEKNIGNSFQLWSSRAWSLSEVSSVHSHGPLSHSSSFSGAEIRAKPGVHCPWSLHRPRNDCKFMMFVRFAVR